MSTRERLATILRVGVVWWPIDRTLGPIARFFRHLEGIREEGRRARLAERAGIDALFASQTVLHGPFQGMRYPELTSVGSAMYPKLLGSYEREIAELIEALCQRDYDTVVDIGCAEGYYAVGLGMRLDSARVYAFDTDEVAKRLCRQMAELNGVEVEIGGFCTPDTLKSMDLGRRGLVVSDCESYEGELFDESVAQALAAHDVLVETHDFVHLDLTERIARAFEPTHRVTEYESVDDIIKAYTYEYKELENLSLAERRVVLSEYRPTIMRWLFLESRQRPAE